MDARTNGYTIETHRHGEPALRDVDGEKSATIPVGDDRPMVLINHLVEPGSAYTGITRYAFGLLEALFQRATFRYTLVTCWPEKDLPPAIAKGADRIVTLPHVRSTPLSFFNQFRQLRKIAREVEADFVYSVNPMSPALPGIPSLVTVHDLYYDVMPELYKKRHLLWWKAYFALAARFVGAIACVSRNTANDLQRFHPAQAAKTCLVPGAGVLPPADPAPLTPEQVPYVLLLGNVTPNKNVPFFIEALAKLRAQGRPVHAIHVGRDLSGDLAKALQGTPTDLLEPRGGLDDAALDALMRGAAALVQPSLYEGFGLPVIEAQERGVPVIATDIPVFREVAGEGAVFVTPGDVDALADALFTITTDHDYRDRLATRSRHNALRYSWNASAQAAEKAVMDALSDR